VKKLLFYLSVCAFFVTLALPAGAQTGYGNVVEINDGEVIVGEPGNRADSGYVYLYRPVDGVWQEVASIVASDATEGDGFGSSIFAEGDEMLIGAVSRDAARVYRFERVDGEWNEVGTLQPFGDGDGAGFGGSIGSDGEWLIIGAAGADDGWGAAYMFRNDNGTWAPAGRLAGERGEIADIEAAIAAAEEAGESTDEIPTPTPESFGAAVAVQGNWAFVGAPAGYQNAGRVYAFRNDDGGWQRVATYDYSVPGDQFGASLEIGDGLLAIGAPTYQPLGAVRRFAYDEQADEWIRIGSVFPFEGASYLFGVDVEIVDDTMYISSPQHVSDGGMIYMYKMDDAYNVYSIEKAGVPGFQQGEALAASFDIEGDTMVLGAPGRDAGAGVAVIMDRKYGTWSSDVFMSEYKGLDPITGGPIECSGGLADRFACSDVDLLSFLPLSAIGGGRGTMTNDVWGWADPDTGKDYALVGLNDATAFIDVSDPLEPIYVGRLPKTESAPAAAWRDIKIDENYAYIVADSAPTHGVQIFNLEHLREYDGEPITFAVDNHYDNVSAAHNIVINEDSAFAYVVGANSGGETCGGGLHMINIEDPNNPSFAGCFADVSTGIQGTGYSHDAQCVIYHGPDEQYQGREICIGSNETAISVADVTDKRNPVALGAATYPNVAYSHQGWFTDDHKYFYMNDEGDEASGLVEGTRTLIWDLQELEDPILVGEYISDNPSVDHNLYIRGDLMFQSNYDSGLRIFDISDRENIRQVAWFDTVPWGPDGGGMTGSWSNYPYFDSGIIVVTSMNEGVFIVKPKEDIGG
jgi:choice-of-anchor B domain-containing protein